MNDYQLLEGLKEILNKDYPVERWMIDDLLNFLKPILLEEFREQYADEVWDEAVAEGYGDGEYDASQECRAELDRAIYEMREEGYDEDTLAELDSRIYF